MPTFSTNAFTLRKALTLLGIGLLLISLIAYVAYQSRNLLQGPSITLNDDYTSPIQHEKIVLVKGTTKNIVELVLNGKKINTDASGSFNHKVILEEGYSILTLSAQDRFGRSTSVQREYVYVPTSTQPLGDTQN